MTSSFAGWRRFRDAVAGHPLYRCTILPAGILLAIWLALAFLVLVMWTWGGWEAYSIIGVFENLNDGFFCLYMMMAIGLAGWLLTGRWLPTLIGLIPIGLALGNYVQQLKRFFFYPSNAYDLLTTEIGLMWKRLAVLALAGLVLLALGWWQSGRQGLSRRMNAVAGVAVVILAMAGLALCQAQDESVKARLLHVLSAAVGFTVFLNLAWHFSETKVGRFFCFSFASGASMVYAAMLVLTSDHGAIYWFVGAVITGGLAILSCLAKAPPVQNEIPAACLVATDSEKAAERNKLMRVGVWVFVMILVAKLCMGAATALATQRLFAICEQGTLEQVQTAIAAGANVNAKKGWYEKETPLMLMAWHTRDPEVIRALLKAGAKVNATTKNGWNALSAALIHNKNPEIALILIAAGADVNARHASGVTPLMRAAYGQKGPKVIEALLRAGADVNAKRFDNMTALMEACWKSKDLEVIRMLLQARADVNAKDRYGRTPLMWASIPNVDPAIIDLLLQSGADVNARTSEGRSALMMATIGTHKEKIAATLIKGGADVNAKDKLGKSVLYYAQTSKNPKFTDLLLQAGAK